MTTVTFAGSGDAFGSGGRFQACIHVRPDADQAPVLLDCGATSLTALRQAGLDPGEIAAVFVSHLHGDHFGGLPFLILDGQFSRRAAPLLIAGPPGTRQRLTEAMECLFPGSTQVRMITAAAKDADLLIAEAYYWDKPVPHHLRHADLTEHEHQITARRVVLTHMSADMLAREPPPGHEPAHDGMIITIQALPRHGPASCLNSAASLPEKPKLPVSYVQSWGSLSGSV
jgi:ribonuclease BN (tRNA processing enzyme)